MDPCKHGNIYSSKMQSEAEVLSLTTLKNIYESVTQSNYLIDDYMVSCLEFTALENEDTTDFIEILQRKRISFECLKMVSYNFTEDFCHTFYDSISIILQLNNPELIGNSGLKKLDAYMNSSPLLEEKILLLHSFTICLCNSDINFCVFDLFSEDVWRCKLLLYALLNLNDAINIMTIERLTKIIFQLQEFLNINEVEWKVEDLLEKLICNQNQNCSNIHFVTDTLLAIQEHPEIFYMLAHNATAVNDKIKDFKLLMLSSHCNIIEILINKHFETLQYILTFPLEVVLNIVKKLEVDDYQKVISFVEMLKYSDLNQSSLIDFLLYSDFNADIGILKYNFFFQIIQRIINNAFPCYNSYTECQNVLHVKETSKISINCHCYDTNSECELHRGTKCCSLLYTLNCTIARTVLSCTNASRKSLDTIEIIISKIDKSEKILDLISALDILEEYDIQFTEREFLNLFSEIISENYERELHKLVVSHSFSGTYEKSVPQLIESMENLNCGLTQHIIELFVCVQNMYDNKSTLFPHGSAIKTWNENQIKLWAALMRKTVVNEAEILAILKRVAEVTIGLCVRDIQLLAVITILKSNIGIGRLCQVNTGEGKTLIIAMTAAYKVLKGHKVDIYTSSPILAIPQSVEFMKFYSVCGITVNNNVAPNSNYDYDVIYGTNNSFQRDVLQDEFRKSGIRKGRVFDVGIVDEVDNMLIDGNNWILKLTRDFPAMDHLEVILGAIYIQVNAVVAALVEKNGVLYFREEEEIFEESGNIKTEIKFREIPLKCSKKDFIMQCTESHIRKLIRDTDDEKVIKDYPEIKIPKHLRHVIANVQIKKWIVSAIESIFNYEQDEDYVLDDGKITIVDANNTGVLKKNSHWCNGLHQFLQIKHGAKIEPENFSSNFISNVGLFTRYSSIFGLTGTLGSPDTRNFLHETYDVDSIIIPSFKMKQHKTLMPKILSDSRSWYLEIASNCIRKLRNGRAVLIIMKFIRETEELYNVFKRDFNYNSSKIKVYKTDNNSEVVETPLSPGDVIITTNIAGRGTDIKLNKKIEKSGGLHICLTFLPTNSRVEEQNIGRTSRKGNSGTSQFILCIPKNKSATINDLKQIRSQKESAYIEKAMSVVKKIKIKENIFSQFCNLLNEINEQDAYVNTIIRKSVEEQFALWLHEHEHTFDNENSCALQNFEHFKTSVINDNRCGKTIKNPYFFVELGNNYFQKEQLETAISEYTKAINLDHDFAENAFYNRAWAYLKLYGGNIEKNELHIRKAISDLESARKLLQAKEYGLHLLQTASKNEVFSEQITNKLNLYNIQKNIIDMAIGPDKEAIEDQLRILKSEKAQCKDSETKDKLSEVKVKLDGDKTNIGIIGRAMENKRNIKIEPLPDDFIPSSEKNKYKDEITEFQRNGWLAGYKITEIKPIDWVSVAGLLGIGLGQLIIGAAITVFSLGAGASIGMGFISEGVSDIITAVKDGIINREFNWATWALMKVISITVSVVCAGLKAIKDVARTAYSGVKNVVTSGLKAFNKVANEGWKIAAKKMGFELAKGVGKEIVTELVNYGIDKSLIPMLEEAIIERVRVPIETNICSNLKVMRMLQLDEKNKDHVFENQIRHIGKSLLSPKTNSILKTLTLHTANCIASHTGLGSVYKILSILQGLDAFNDFTSDFIRNFNKAINEIKFEDGEAETSNTCEKQISDENQEGCQKISEATNNYEDIDLNKVGKSAEQVRQKRKLCTPNDLSVDFAGLVSTNMIQIMKGQIVSPITQMGVSYSVDGLSSKINKSLESQTETFRAGKRILDDNNRKYENIFEEGTNQQQNNEDFEETKMLIDRFEDGGPVSLVHLGALSKAANKPIEVYDSDGELMFPVRDTQGCEPIKLQYHDNGNDVGHFTLLGKEEPLMTGAGDNMCAFNCIAQLCNKDPNLLKGETVNILRNNHRVLTERLGDIKMLETCKNSVLALKGGAEYYGKNYLDAYQYISSSEGKCGFGNKKNPGHPEIHISYKGDPKLRLAMLSDVIGKKIVVKGKKGNELYTIGSQYEGDPIVLQYNVDKKDPAGNYFSEPGGKEKLMFHHDNDSSFYAYIGNKTRKDPNALKTATDTKINNFTVPQNSVCVENKQVTSKPPTGFFTKDDEAFLLHHVLKSEVVKNKLDQLNQYKPGERQDTMYKKVPLTIPVQDLNLPRQVMAGEWLNGKLISTFPVKSVFVLIQHHHGQQSNPKAQVQIQTIYPPS